jgi:N-acetylglucosamine-6-sulfatase
MNKKFVRTLAKFILFSLFVITVFSFFSGVKKNENKSSRPNIIFILLDDQAWNAWGRDGKYNFLNTPNINQLADEGMNFKNAFVTTSLCSPSRACYMTGSYVHTNGVYVNSYADPDPQVPFLPKILQDAGYETAFLGKWHMKPGAEPRKGFDYWLSFDGQGQYTDPPLNENGRDFIQKGYITNILTDYAERWIQKPRDKPFCLFIWHKAVHAPFTPDPKDSTAFSDARISEYENWYDDMADKPQWLRRGWLYGVQNKNWLDSKGKPVPDKIDPHPWNPQEPKWMNYLRAMLAVDRSVGEVRKCLEENQLLDNTIIVYGSDNGFFLGAHQRGDKRLMYEESLRVPLIVRYPKLIKPGSVNNEMVLNIDVAPTLIELAGAKIPDKMQGTSFVPLLVNKKTDWRKSFMYEYFQEAYAPGLVTVVGVRTKRYKYIESLHRVNDINELYDLEKDPGEMDNIGKIRYDKRAE